MKTFAYTAFIIGNFFFLLISILPGAALLFSMFDNTYTFMISILLLLLWGVYYQNYKKIKQATEDTIIKYHLIGASISWGSLFILFGSCMLPRIFR